MPSEVELFSDARLRPLRALEAAGLGSAIGLSAWNLSIGATLWLPISIAEIAFRNLADRVASVAHSQGPDWLFDITATGDPRSKGNPQLVHAGQDPITEAYEQAVRQGITSPTRDDVIAHLTLGFWTVRTPNAFLAASPPMNLFEDLLDRIGREAFPSAGDFKSAIARLHLLRNRVAHHEPLALRAKYLLNRDGTARTGLALLHPLADALTKFAGQVDNVEKTSLALAPGLREQILGAIATLRTELGAFGTKVDVLTSAAVADRERRRQANGWNQQPDRSE